MQRIQEKYIANTPQISAKERVLSDIQYSDVLYVYRLVNSQDSLGDSIKGFMTVPLAIQCSYQEHALDSERNNYDRINSHYARIFTRHRNVVSWGDKIVCRGIEMVCTKALDRIDNFDGSFHHTEIRGKYTGVLDG